MSITILIIAGFVLGVPCVLAWLSRPYHHGHVPPRHGEDCH